MQNYGCPECGFDGPHSPAGEGVLECGRCFLEFATGNEDVEPTTPHLNG